ncbi:NAD(P)-dependent oxidoreductase [Sulfuriferula sp.]|uniref:NAD-dependent epimerase/dehydratase family protein n=1 Tax=Sulfuriferula sp. TaxID=2025307 RepID=UPI00273042E9|nr:NAD(P)-dependent oxidoreductase [Sulfuriferula sp.]MDP2024889.1 NAD(P)-dependent oxidoreductase [Sulfuriferula sp.]
MKRALVTGGAGFIGSHVVDELVATGHEVHVIDNFMNGRREHLAGLPPHRIHEVDIRDQDGLARKVAEIAPQLVYHLAAIHFIPYCTEHPTESVLINIQGTQNLLDALTAAPVERLFFASTAAVYPPKDGRHLETDPSEPMDVYGATKSAGEALVKAYAHTARVPVVIGRLFNAVGHRETNPHLLPEIVKQLATGARTLHLGNLDPRRDFVDTRDMAKAIVAASLAVSAGSDVFNIGSCRQYSVIEVVQICERVLGETIEVVQDPSRVRKVERQSLLAGIDKLTAATGWTPEIDLEQTLRELLKA